LPPCSALDTAAAHLSAARESNPQAYLCTGCDAFLTHEPGVMDAMALIHSRIARVFYTFPHPGRPQAGALQGAVRLHTLPSINHRFRVFRVEGMHS
jgi:tRNA-specific adenosine deaminase 3